MSGMSHYVEAATAAAWLRGTAPTVPSAPLSLKIYANGAPVADDGSGGTELQGRFGGAAAVALTNFTTPGSDGVSSNSAAITFSSVLDGSGGSVVAGHFGIWSGSTLLFSGDLIAPKTLDPGDAVSFPIGSLQIIFN